MADNHLTLFCLVDGEDTSNAYLKRRPTASSSDLRQSFHLSLAPAPTLPSQLSDQSRPSTPLSGMLCLQWGLYLNAAKNELGLNDLSRLPDSIGTEAMEEQGPGHNTAFACNKTLLLFLSRLLVLKYCLRISDCRQTFSSASWALLQVCLHMFQDVFSELLSILYNKLEGLTIFESALRPIVRHELLSVRKSLAAHAYPNFSSESKLRLVVDKAQDLSDKGNSPADSDLSSRLFEGILEIVKWNAAIDKTETMITSWKDRERRGNLCGEFNR
ncbi:hypothetical protein KI688_004872 [Linnemannia hyalina]|uniref:Uncharacterized protein n=1 Tax=Linnemannia hyalina TaxID=64524 RepID=A0A9P7XNB5_9FUNG|nr:hypothetical protein KI688_004872 [Linnemannia hyalina]